MTSLRIRQYGHQESLLLTARGEMEDELIAQIIEAIRNSHITVPAGFEDLHLTCWTEELGGWVEI